MFVNSDNHSINLEGVHPADQDPLLSHFLGHLKIYIRFFLIQQFVGKS